jgi:hypothetical protein
MGKVCRKNTRGTTEALVSGINTLQYLLIYSEKKLFEHKLSEISFLIPELDRQLSRTPEQSATDMSFDSDAVRQKYCSTTPEPFQLQDKNREINNSPQK